MLAEERVRRGRGWRVREVQDPVAVIALQDRVVAAEGVEDLGTQADVADRADAVARLGHRDAVALAGDLLEGREHALVERADQRRAFHRDAID